MIEIIPFTAEHYPSIVAIHNSQNIVWPERPRTAEAWAAMEKKRDPRHLRWVAVADDRRVVGFADFSQSPWAYPPHSFQINVEVLPEYQRCGIGTALYDQLMQGLQAFDPPALRADAFTNLPQGFSFLQKRGFYEAFRETPVHLDIASFDPSPYADLESNLKSEGIVIMTLRELEFDPDRDRKLYELYWETDKDMPHEGEQLERAPFEEWQQWDLNSPSVLPDAYFISVHAGRYIGLRELGQYPEGDVLMGGLLGVRREYRKRGIGLAMQLRGIAYAREHGIRQLKTCTAVQNAPMQALFNKLGYARDPEWQQCQKDLKDKK